MPCNYKKYPKNWTTEIRPRILERANNCCEFCGVKNYSVGFREDSFFVLAGGNYDQDAGGRGELSYKDAKELAELNNQENDTKGKYIVIVLTIAHLDHDTNNNVDSNLRALCQRCHLHYDLEHHKKNRKETISKKQGKLSLF
jgi:hypothetical protein